MSNSIWKMPDQKPDVFKPHTIMVVYEAHDEAELMLSTQYETYTADRYINRWCYLDELLAQADKAERLQKAVDLAILRLEQGKQKFSKSKMGPNKEIAMLCDIVIDEIKQLIKENQ